MRLKISIITITYNNLIGLCRTAESVLSQTITNFEWIIVDGASTDGTQVYLQNIRQQWQGRPEYLQIISEQDSGIYNAMNKGIRLTHGEYLQFLNAGDYLTSPSILEQICSLPIAADVIYGNRIDIYSTGETKKHQMPTQITAYFLWHSMISHQASFIRRTLFDTVGLYREDLKYASDWEFFLKAFVQHNATSEYVDLDIVYFDKGGRSSNMANRMEMIAERKRVFAETLPYLVTDFEDMDTYIQTLRQYDRRANAVGKKILYLPRTIRKWCRFIFTK